MADFEGAKAPHGFGATFGPIPREFAELVAVESPLLALERSIRELRQPQVLGEISTRLGFADVGGADGARD
jgi:hypothetical protein